MSKNRAEIDGHLGADPEIRTGQSGARVMTFRVGTSERWTDKSGEKQERTHWHSVVCFQAWIIDAIGHRLQKGSRVHVEGQMETRDYEDKNGVKRWVTEIVVRGGASNILPIDWPKSERAPPPQDHRQQPASTRHNAAPIDDDIPF